MNVLHVASEVAPYSKTGGLADVASALPRAIAAQGDRVAICTPRYRIDPARFHLARRLRSVTVPLGGATFEVGVLEGRLPGSGGAVQAFLLDHPLFDRAGLYGEGGHDYPDNALRFGLLSRGTLAVARAFGFVPDVVHAHDWQAAPALLYARRFDLPAARTLLTIHNLAFQGLFPRSAVNQLGLGADLFHPEGIEFWGSASFLKAGILFADRITTVSPTYAREVQTEEFGCGLDGVLRRRDGRFSGVLNGADYDLWNPERDPALPAHFSSTDLAGKRACKTALQRALGLPPRPRMPLTAAVSRITEQKGCDLLAEVLERLLPERAMQVAILGSGDPAIEERLTALQARFPSQLAVRIGHDEALAHRLYAGADLFVMPSRYEPCGLGQIYALRYGAPPIVRATGGLADTVLDHDPRSLSGTGFTFRELSASALAGAWQRALAAYTTDEKFPLLIRRAMEQDFSWSRSAESYRLLYRG
ncbi:MAG: glycogen synthase GlgA [Myxococcales bacterium]|nr:glycogen synthase GlgA [Myxococcales bacterium]